VNVKFKDPRKELKEKQANLEKTGRAENQGLRLAAPVSLGLHIPDVPNSLGVREKNKGEK